MAYLILIGALVAQIVGATFLMQSMPTMLMQGYVPLRLYFGLAWFVGAMTGFVYGGSLL